MHSNFTTYLICIEVHLYAFFYLMHVFYRIYYAYSFSTSTFISGILIRYNSFMCRNYVFKYLFIIRSFVLVHFFISFSFVWNHVAHLSSVKSNPSFPFKCAKLYGHSRWPYRILGMYKILEKLYVPSQYQGTFPDLSLHA